MKQRIFRLLVIILLSIIASGYIIYNNLSRENNNSTFKRKELENNKISSEVITKKNIQGLESKEYNKKSHSSELKRKPTYTIKKKVVYLTFDDGPNNTITNGVMDVLNEYNVKGTFFIVGKEINRREKTLKRICNEGFGIGLHSYSHNLKHIYENPDIFIKEMEDTNKLIYNIAGCRTNIIRFPGGSFGRLDKVFIDKLHSCGYKIFDWTNSAEDGLHPEYSTEKLYETALKQYPAKMTAPGIIILFHNNSNNKNTITVLPKIIEYYKKKGYDFDIITDKTPEFYFK